MDNIAALALPFLLIVNFAQLLNAHDGYQKQLVLNGAAMAGICALYYLVFYRYIVGGLAAFLQEPFESLDAVTTLVFGFSMGEVTQSLKAGDEAAQLEAASIEAAPGEAASGEAVSGEGQEIPEELQLLLAQLQQAVGDEGALPPEELTEAEIKALEEAAHEARINASIDSGIRLAEAVGFGGSVYLFLLVPMVLLLSYTRKPKNRLLDALIPVGGVALILLVYVEGTHQLLGRLPIPKVDLNGLKDMITVYMRLLL